MTLVGEAITSANASWTFGGDVHEKFDTHVRRSVPLYAEGHDLIAKVSDFFVADGSTVYDLGCSTGELTRRLAGRHAGKKPTVVGVDREPGMCDSARARCADHPGVRIECAELTEFELQPSDLIVSYLTLQFIRPRFRQELIDRIYAALNWGGAFVLVEKVRAPDARFQDLATALYTDFKLDQGYDESEIVQKTRSLKGVLEPFSTQGNLDMLQRAGFVDCMTVFKYVCFEGFLAIK